MDTFSHGLWGGVAFGRQNKFNYVMSFLFGMAPDLFSFGVFDVLILLGIGQGVDWSNGVHELLALPHYLYTLYNITHSFFTFLIIFGIVWLIRKKPWWLMCSWGLHILIDIVSHSKEFFPTPFLWPVSHFTFDGVAWSKPLVLAINYGVLFFLYLSWLVEHKIRKHIRTVSPLNKK
jgi:hypothetical protein